MNKLMIVIAALTVGALVPAPPAQGIELSECTQQAVDAAGQALQALDDFADTPPVMGLPPLTGIQGRGVTPVLDCLGDTQVPNCEELLNTVQLRNDPLDEEKFCSLQCEEIVQSVGGIDFAEVSCDRPETGACDSEESGIVLGNNELCIATSDLVPECLQPTIHVSAPGVSACKFFDDGGAQDPPEGASCEKRENDNGFGGTFVTCEYACYVGDELAIYAEAFDVRYGTAEADGYTKCGGAEADCNPIPAHKNICAGASAGPATRRQLDSECRGRSKEYFDSEVVVACYTFGTSTLCDLVPDAPVCNDSLTAYSAHKGCINSLEIPQADGPVLEYLVGLLVPNVGTSFVAFKAGPIGGLAVGSSTGPDGVTTCWLQPL